MTNFERLRKTKSVGKYVRKPQPHIVTLLKIANSIKGFRPNRQVYYALTGEERPPTKLGTVGQLQASLEELGDLPGTAPAYVVHANEKQGYNSAPILWAGEVKSKIVLLAYVDPIRYGFDSQSKRLLTIGPADPMRNDKRVFGVVYDFNAKTGRLQFTGMPEIVTTHTLSSRFDPHWRHVIGDRVATIPRERGKRGPLQYQVQNPLPTKEEYEQLRTAEFTKSVGEWVDHAYGVVDELAGELEEAYENMPESLQDSEIAEARLEAADALGAIDRPDVPPKMAKRKLYCEPHANVKTRSDRAYEVAHFLRTVAEALDNDDKAKLLADELGRHADELEDVEFPGMYG